jgi:hypothetical protein
MIIKKIHFPVQNIGITLFIFKAGKIKKLNPLTALDEKFLHKDRKAALI